MTTTNHMPCPKCPAPSDLHQVVGTTGVSPQGRYPLGTCPGVSFTPSQWEPLSQVPARVYTLCDRAWLLDQGRVEFDDTDLDLVEMEALRAQFPGAIG